MAESLPDPVAFSGPSVSRGEGRSKPLRSPKKPKTSASTAAAAPGTDSEPLIDQWDLPVTYDPSGRMLTLREMLQPNSAALPVASLGLEKLVEITTLRIAAQPKFEVAMIGAGLVDKARALQEVAAQSDVGRQLVEIEQRMIQRVLRRAAGIRKE